MFKIIPLFLFFFLSVVHPNFANEDWDKRVYLTSFPRSGNHWVRFLIEEATYITTSSAYRDRDFQHLTTPFPWDGYCEKNGYEGNCRYPEKGEIFVVKTHFPVFKDKFGNLPSIRTVRIIRHPIDSFYSYFIHKGNNPDSKIPKKLLERYIFKWREFQEYWNSQENVLDVRYEDLYNDPHSNLKKILEYIGYEVQEKDIIRALEKHPPKGALLKHLNHYDANDLEQISYKLNDLLNQFGYKIPESNTIDDQEIQKCYNNF